MTKARLNALCEELLNSKNWAIKNNLCINSTKTKEIIFTDSRKPKNKLIIIPEMPDVKRVTSLKILGIIINNKFSVSEHITETLIRCAQSLHVLRTL